MKRRSADEWRALDKAWRSSGLTGKVFAAREGVNQGSLQWWRGHFKKQPRVKGQQNLTPPVVEVLVTASSQLEVILPSATKVSVPVGFDESTLRRLLSVLER